MCAGAMQSEPAAKLERRVIRAGHRSLQSADQDQADIAPAALHILHRAACHPPASADLFALQTVQFGNRVAHPHQDQVGHQRSMGADIMILHFQSDQLRPGALMIPGIIAFALPGRMMNVLLLW